MGSDKRYARELVSDTLSRSARPAVQLSLDAVGTPASDGHWVVVDLETTGLGGEAEITEIGAVRVRGGCLADEFSSLARPCAPIPPFITSLTGITPAMVADADPIGPVLERFLEWSGLEGEDAPVLVAHNASFDVGFLRRAARASGRPWPKVRVVDTLGLARLALPRPLVRNHKLGTIASYFGTATVPEHRALGDARATAEVLLGFVDLLASAGVTDVEDLLALSDAAPSRRPATPSFVAELPSAPGVYHFVDVSGDALYVGSGLVPALARGQLLHARGEAPEGPAHGVPGDRGAFFSHYLRAGGARAGAARHRGTGTAIQLSVAQASQSALGRARSRSCRRGPPRRPL